MKLALFQLLDALSTLSFLHTSKKECNWNGIHEGPLKWPFPYFVKDTVKPLSLILCLSRKTIIHKKKKKLSTYRQVVTELLATYAADDVIVKAEAEITNFKKYEHTSAYRYKQVLWEKSLRRFRVFERNISYRRFYWMTAWENQILNEYLLESP